MSEGGDQAYNNPAYQIPLSGHGLRLVGLFVATWGQLEFFMAQCIAGLLKVDVRAAVTLSDVMTSETRLYIFHRLAKKHLKDMEMLSLAEKFHEEMSHLMEARNHMMRGIWGLRVDQNDPSISKVAVYYAKDPSRPIWAEDIEELTKRIAALTHMIVKITHHLFGFQWRSDPINPPSFFMGDGPPPAHLGEFSSPKS